MKVYCSDDVAIFIIQFTNNQNMKAIGNTPLLKLERLSEPGCAEIYVKYEGANATGSMKDRMALSMIEGAERRGQLKTRRKSGRLYRRQHRKFTGNGMRY